MKKKLLTSLFSMALALTLAVTATDITVFAEPTVSSNETSETFEEEVGVEEDEIEEEEVNWEEESYFSKQGLSPEEAAELEAEYREKYGEDALQTSLIPEDISYLKESAWDSTTMVRGTQASGNYFLNLILNDVWSYNPPYGVPFEFEGQIYYFNSMSNYVGSVKAANKAGIPVSVELLLKSSERGYPGLELYDPTAIANYQAKPKNNNYWAPNVVNESSRYYRAELAYLAQMFSQADCHIDNWIVGNEVNMPNSWYFTGSSDPQYNANLYAAEYLAVYNAVHQYTDKSRVSFCFDHSWQHNDEGRGIAVKDYLNRLVAAINAIQPNVDWTISYHMYPAYLPEAAVWTSTPFEGLCGRDLNPRHEGAEFVDGYNLFVMTDYIKQNYGTSHKIMLTEQGFARTMGDEVQAASLALSYYAAKYDPMVDAFIINVANEGGNQDFSLSNLALAVWNHLDDAPEYVESVTLPVIGIGSYAEIIPNYGVETKKADRTKVKAFVSRIYELALGREPEEEGLLYWTDELCSGRMTGAEVAGGFFFSPEMKNKNLTDEEFIEICYKVMMDRTSDEGGMNYWLDCRKNAFGLEGIFNEFCQSKEFNGICNNYGISAGSYNVTGCSRNMGMSAFMSRLYTKALGRAYDQEGLDYWCEEIYKGNYTLMQVSTEQFFHSKEFLSKNLNDEEYVKVLYRTFFDREYDQSGMDYWMAQLKAGKDRDFILSEFANSQEFAKIKAAYGLN